MPDISMCNNIQCTLKEVCYRFKAKPSDWQTYADFKQDKDGKCKYYWKLNFGKIK